MAGVTSTTHQIGAKKVRVWAGGKGRPLLLLHGGIGDAEQHWGKIFTELAKTHFVIAPDLPGMGESEPLDELSWSNIFAWLDAILDAYEIKRVDVVGNSFGGALARLYSANRPERVERTSLVNGGLVPQIPGFLRVMMRTSWLWAPIDWLSRQMLYSRFGLRMMIRRESVLTDAFVLGARKGAVSFSRTMNELFASEPPAKLISDRPPALIWGQDDKFAPPSVADKLERELGARSKELIAGSGHMPQLEAPTEFVAALERTLVG